MGNKKAKIGKKLTLEELVSKADAAKKANPLDLSSDQDLTIALMNLISIEEHFFFSGAKTKRTRFYDLINVIRNMRKELMLRIVKPSSTENGEVWCVSKHLLAASMRLMEVGTKALSAGKKKDAENLFGKAYELYSLFWGINMDLIDLSKVKKDETMDKNLMAWVNDKSRDRKQDIQNKENEKGSFDLSKPANEEKHGILSVLGNWVKKTVDCCIE